MGKSGGFIIVILGLVGAFFILKDKLAEHKDATNPWVTRLKPIIADHLAMKVDAQSEAPWYDGQSTMMATMAMMYRCEQAKFPLDKTLASAVSAAAAGRKSGFQRMVAENLMDNFAAAKTLGVFKDPANLLRMENGDAPYAKAAGWEEELVVVGHKLSPIVAPEAASSLANLVLMPEIARDLQTHEVRGFTNEHIKKWREEGIIDSASAKDLYELVHPDS
jgi:hypothetical protein